VRAPKLLTGGREVEIITASVVLDTAKVLVEHSQVATTTTLKP